MRADDPQGGILTFSVASAEDSNRAASAVAVASICWRGTAKDRQGLARVLVIEGKESAAAAAIDCLIICQHLASVFGIQGRSVRMEGTYKQQTTVERHRHE